MIWQGQTRGWYETDQGPMLRIGMVPADGSEYPGCYHDCPLLSVPLWVQKRVLADEKPCNCRWTINGTLDDMAWSFK